MSGFAGSVSGPYNGPVAVAEKRPDRRAFIRRSAVMGAGLLASPAAAWSATGKADELERLIGRLVFLNMYWRTPPGFFLDLVERYHLGGAYLDKNPLITMDAAQKATGSLGKAAPEPMLLVTDCEGGAVNKLRGVKSFESAGELGSELAAGELDGSGLYYKVEERVKLVKQAGLNMNFDPVLDLAVRGSAIGGRSFGSDPAAVAGMARTVLGAYKEVGVAATGKHFPGLGSIRSDTHHVLPRLDKSVDELMKEDLVPFKAAIESGVPAIMVAHVRVTALDKDRPASLSTEVIGGLLRKELGFKGLVVTDSLTMGAITKYYAGKGITGDAALGRRCVDALKAGADMIFNFHTHPNKTPVIIRAIKRAVIEKDLSRERIEGSVERMRRVLGSVETDGQMR